MTDTVLQAVLTELLKQSDVFVSGTVEYPGYIALHTDGNGLWNIGTASGTWGADLYIDESSCIEGESPDHTITTLVPAICADVDEIVQGVFAAMTSTQASKP